MLRVLIADVIHTNRLGFRSVLEERNHRVIIDEVASQAELVKNLRARAYDLVVVEPTIAEDSGEALLRKIRSTDPKVHILVLTLMEELTFGIKALQCGAKGYLTKTCDADELASAVLTVGCGKVYITASLAELISHRSSLRGFIPTHESLSDREFQVFSMVISGEKISDIAVALSLSAKTVSTHKQRILSKLEIKSVAEAVKYAISQGLIQECRIRSDAAIAKASSRRGVIGSPRHSRALPEPAVGKNTGTISLGVPTLVRRVR